MSWRRARPARAVGCRRPRLAGRAGACAAGAGARARGAPRPPSRSRRRSRGDGAACGADRAAAPRGAGAATAGAAAGSRPPAGPGRAGGGAPRSSALDQIGQRHQLAQVDPAQQRHLEVIARLHRRRGSRNSALVSTSNARIRSSAENRARERRAAARAPPRRRSPDRWRATDRSQRRSRSRVRRASSRTTEPQVVAGLDRAAGQLEHGAAHPRAATASAMSSSRSRRTRPSTVATSSAVIVVPGKGDHLVERALRVAHAAVAGARHQHQRRLVDLRSARRSAMARS